MELKIIIVNLSFGTLRGAKTRVNFQSLKINFQNRFVANNKDLKLIGSFSWKTKKTKGKKLKNHFYNDDDEWWCLGPV